MKHQIVLIEGDGIGPEISRSVRTILDHSGVDIDWVPIDAGLCSIERHGVAITDEALDRIAEVGVALKGPTTTPVGGGHSSVNVQIRKALGLYANVRMARTLPGVKTRYENIDLVVVRENVEDTYGGIEYMQTPDVALGFKFITRKGSEAIVRYAFEYARQMGRRKVSCIHKANIHKMSDGLFLRVFREVADEYAEIEANDVIVDNCCMQLVSRPEQFDVMVLPNLYGDIVSDLCAGLIGGLGVAPGANIGENLAIFEAVHGSAPDIAGKGIANPTALLQSAVHMLRYLGETHAAANIEAALHGALEAGEKTGDLGGSLDTAGFTDAVIARLSPVSGERVVVPRRITQRVDREHANVQQKLVGVDVYVRDESLPDCPKSVGPFVLTGCANRGTNITDVASARAELVDWWRVRFMAEGAAGDNDVDALITELNGKVTWMHVEKLYEHNGLPAFTR